MHPTALRSSAFLAAIDADDPQSRRPVTDAATLLAMCDRVLALQAEDFPRQGVTQEKAQHVAGLVKSLLIGSTANGGG